jgi:transposase
LLNPAEVKLLLDNFVLREGTLILLAASTGLSQSELFATGGKAKLYGISKRGNRYLHKILIHGARAVVLRSKRDHIAMGEWMTALEMRAPQNVLIVAMANKLARIAWAVLSTGQDYRAVPEPIAA